MFHWLGQQFTEESEAVTHPFSCALSSSGTECVAHVVQSLTSMDSNATIFFVHQWGQGTRFHLDESHVPGCARSSQR